MKFFLRNIIFKNRVVLQVLACAIAISFGCYTTTAYRLPLENNPDSEKAKNRCYRECGESHFAGPEAYYHCISTCPNTVQSEVVSLWPFSTDNCYKDDVKGDVPPNAVCVERKEGSFLGTLAIIGGLALGSVVVITGQ